LIYVLSRYSGYYAEKPTRREKSISVLGLILNVLQCNINEWIDSNMYGDNVNQRNLPPNAAHHPVGIGTYLSTAGHTKARPGGPSFHRTDVIRGLIVVRDLEDRLAATYQATDPIRSGGVLSAYQAQDLL
jgi:hypothetical protein